MIFGLFKKKIKIIKTTPADKNITVGSTKIPYKPELIDEFKSDHKRLLGIYMVIKLAAETKNFKKVTRHLTDFRNEFEDHLLKENINLYIYLSHLLKDNEVNSALIASFHKEMDRIASAALKFLAKYESIDTDEELQNSFASDFSAIGDVLGKRIKREESMLYTLYIPPY